MHRALLPIVLTVLLLAAAAPAPAPAEEPEAVAADGTPTVFYFHGERRCMTCRAIEKAADTVVHGAFAEELENGSLAWKVVNFDEDRHRHYVEEIGLPGSGVVLARVTPGGEVREPEILQKVWVLSRDEKKMRDYLRSEIETFLGKAR